MHLDRLSALFRHVKFRVAGQPIEGAPRLRVIPEQDHIRVSFCQRTQPEHKSDCDISLDFGSKDSPLLLALPEELHVTFAPQDSAYPVAQMIVQETAQARCGSPAVLDRLFEVLMIMLLRRAIETGQESMGLLAGLADDHLKRALVAVHESPEKDWNTERLAELALLSRTAFYQRFNKLLGIAPMAYVRGWRLSLARLRLAQGDRIADVARQVGYGSTEGFSRAFYQQFECWPGEAQKTG
jgi:AraC-like DNA-binding protein